MLGNRAKHSLIFHSVCEKSCKSFGFHIGLTAQMIWSRRCKFVCVWNNVYHSFCVVPKNSLANNSMKIDWNFQGRSQEHLKRPKMGMVGDQG